MKTVIFLILFMMLLPVLLAQTPFLRQKGSLTPEENTVAPKVNPEKADSTDQPVKVPLKPEVQVIPKPRIQRDSIDLFRMPVASAEGFHSNMPIKVPDSTVHYFIKQAFPEQPFQKKK